MICVKILDTIIENTETKKVKNKFSFIKTLKISFLLAPKENKTPICFLLS